MVGQRSLDQNGGMRKLPDPHYLHRFPAELISHAVWLYHIFSLSFRDVELLLGERGVIVSYESVRQWCLKFGASFADKMRRRRPRPGDKWHLDEVFIRIKGELHFLWRAVDRHGVVLDILVQSRRDAGAAKRFFRRLAKSLQYVPRVLITGKLGSYGVAQRELLPNVEHTRRGSGEPRLPPRGAHHQAARSRGRRSTGWGDCRRTRSTRPAERIPHGIVTLTSVGRADATSGYVVPITQFVEVPDAESLGSDCTIRISGQQMTAWVEMAMDECVSRKEVLSLLGRFESLHLALATSCRPV